MLHMADANGAAHGHATGSRYRGVAQVSAQGLPVSLDPADGVRQGPPYHHRLVR